MIHLEGMGMIGSLVAHTLADRSVRFTWSDADTDVTAWRASTGAIFPASDARSLAGMLAWRRLLERNAFHWMLEEAEYWYCTKQPPHGFRVQPGPRVQVGSLKLHELTSLHLNVQAFVTWTREKFAAYREDEPSARDTVFVTHGFNQRLARYVWGWTCPVKLHGLACFPTRVPGRRHAIYLRQGRVVMAYAYPIPGSDTWYAGSSLIVQSTPKPLSKLDKYQRWQRWFEQLSGLQVEKAGDLVEGWRPSTGPVDHEADEPLLTKIDRKYVVMPLWHSGVRWAPLVADAVLEVCGVLRKRA